MKQDSRKYHQISQDVINQVTFPLDTGLCYRTASQGQA